MLKSYKEFIKEATDPHYFTGKNVIKSFGSIDFSSDIRDYNSDVFKKSVIDNITNKDNNIKTKDSKVKDIEIKYSIDTLKSYKDFTVESKKENNLWNYDGNFTVDKSMVMNGKFIKDKIPDIIKGDFYCHNSQLLSLEGGPKEVKGSFYSYGNLLTSLEGGPEDVGGFFDCSYNKLKTLKGISNRIGIDFDCRYNQLTTLIGCIKLIRGDFNCGNNQLTSLEGGPKIVEESFGCEHNQLTSLEGGPSYVGESFFCYKNLLTSLEGSPEEIEKVFNCSDNPNLKSLEGGPKIIGKYLKSDLKIESKFINNKSYKNNYWNDLLKYMINKKIDLSKVESWPKNFLTDETIKSAKGISKFNL